ncbi:MAG TPA: sigma-70 family RNA polymerase sigma factor [Luteolibacter sp.]|nr:sigma-70 family RNA polymerase sigma factor [Luteolibacter sp.]
MTGSRDNFEVSDASSDPDDAAVIASARAGSMEAFGELVRRYQGNIRACLVIRLKNPHDAEDLAQDTFITAFNKLPEFDTKLPLGPWLRGIAFNLLRNFQKKNRPIAIGAETELAGLIDVRISEKYTSNQESHIFTALEDCMEKLDPSARQLLHRRYHDDAAVQDIAKESQRNHSTVTMQLHRLRAALAECIRNHEETKP